MVYPRIKNSSALCNRNVDKFSILDDSAVATAGVNHGIPRRFRFESEIVKDRGEVRYCTLAECKRQRLGLPEDEKYQ